MLVRGRPRAPCAGSYAGHLVEFADRVRRIDVESLQKA
jgi:hypothetical protein